MTEVNDPALYGAVVSRHWVRNKRLVAYGAVALPLGLLIFGAVVTLVITAPSGPPTPNPIGAGVRYFFALPLVAVIFGGVALVRAWRRGLVETYEVRERGLVHHAKGRARGWYWESVDTIDVTLLERNTFITRFLNGDYVCRVRFKDGQRLQFNGATMTLPENLEKAIRRNCPSVGARETPPVAILLAVLIPILFVAALVTGILLAM